ncbi:hypothetical protein QJQ45_021456, partial [Haematococcus lacustris]
MDLTSAPLRLPALRVRHATLRLRASNPAVRVLCFPVSAGASGSGQQVKGQGQAVKVVIAERRQVIKAALRGLVEAAQPDLGPAEVDAVVAEVNKRMTMGSKQCVLAAVMSLTVLLLSFLGQPTPGFPAAAGPAPGPPPPPDPDHPPYAHPRIPTRISPRTAAAPAQLPPPVQLGIWDPQLLAQIRDAMELITKASVQEHLMRGPHHHGIRLLPGEVAAFEQPSSTWPVAMLQQLDEEHLTGDGNSLNANATTIITSIQQFYRHPGRFIRWWCKAVGVVEEGFSRAMKKHFPQLVLGRLDYSLPDRQHKWRLPANSVLRQPRWKEEVAKHRRLLGLAATWREGQDSIGKGGAGRLPLEKRVRYVLFVNRSLEGWQAAHDTCPRPFTMLPMVGAPPPAPAQDPPAPAPAQAPPPPPPAQAPPAQAPPPAPPAQAQPLPAAPGPAPPPQAPPGGRWLDRDTNGCLNLQRIGESRQRPLELCQWDDLEALPPIGSEYQQRYKRVNDRLPKGRQWVGVGLYFKALVWMKWMFLVLLIFAIPYLVVINTSVFTDEAHRFDHNFGVKVYRKPNLYSMTFAAILGGSADNSTLQYMNADIAGAWRGPMSKGDFLTWISLTDAAAIVVALGMITYFINQARKFIQQVDDETLEMSDYSVMVHGLPRDANAHEVGHFFSRFGEVMDVVIVRDMRSVLAACSRASHLEQLRKFHYDRARIGQQDVPTQLHKAEAEAVDKKLGKVLEKLEGQAGGPDQFATKAAFVTFNRKRERDLALANFPMGWLRAVFFTPTQDKFRSQHALWLSMASAPDDYNHENIACSPALRAASVLFARGIVVAMLLLCAAMITKLSTISMDQNSAIPWQQSRMVQKVGSSAAQLGPLPINLAPSSASVTGQLVSAYTAAVSAAQARLAAMAPASANSSNSPLSGVAPSGGWAAAAGDNTLIAAAANWTGYCSIMLPRVCQPMFSDQLSGVGVRLDWGSLLHWDNQTEMLLKERPLLLAMANCASSSSAGNQCIVRPQGLSLALSACLPCYCLGLASSDSGQRVPEWRDTARGQCSLYVQGIDLQAWGIKIATAAVIAGLNSALKMMLEILIVVERHQTRSQQERSYAGQAYTSQLLNTAVVLLLVNASPAADASRDNARRVLLMIQVFTPLLTIAWDVAFKLAQRCLAKFDEAFARPEFSLQERVADAMLNITLALLFGSGMPIAYALVLLILPHHLTLTLAQITSGSDPALLPYAALVHCVFGLWMHTYFTPTSSDILPNDVDARFSSTTLSPPPPASSSASPSPPSPPEQVASVTSLLMSYSGSTAGSLAASALIRRMTQANGLALLACTGVLVLWLLARNFMWNLVRRGLTCCLRTLCCGGCSEQLLSPSQTDQLTLEMALTLCRSNGTTEHWEVSPMLVLEDDLSAVDAALGQGYLPRELLETAQRLASVGSILVPATPSSTRPSRNKAPLPMHMSPERLVAGKAASVTSRRPPQEAITPPFSDRPSNGSRMLNRQLPPLGPSRFDNARTGQRDQSPRQSRSINIHVMADGCDADAAERCPQLPIILGALHGGSTGPLKLADQPLQPVGRGAHQGQVISIHEVGDSLLSVDKMAQNEHGLHGAASRDEPKLLSWQHFMCHAPGSQHVPQDVSIQALCRSNGTTEHWEVSPMLVLEDDLSAVDAALGQGYLPRELLETAQRLASVGSILVPATPSSTRPSRNKAPLPMHMSPERLVAGKAASVTSRRPPQEAITPPFSDRPSNGSRMLNRQLPPLGPSRFDNARTGQRDQSPRQSRSINIHVMADGCDADAAERCPQLPIILGALHGGSTGRTSHTSSQHQVVGVELAVNQATPVSSALLTSLLFMPAQVLGPLQPNNARSEGLNGTPSADRYAPPPCMPQHCSCPRTIGVPALPACQKIDRNCLQVIKVPGGAVLRGCKKTKRKLLAHFQLRAGIHSQLRVIASLYVLRIFLTCLVGYRTPGYPNAPTPPAVQPPLALDAAPLPPLPLRAPAQPASMDMDWEPEPDPDPEPEPEPEPEPVPAPPTLRPPSARLAARHPPPAAPTGPPMPLDSEDPVLLQQLKVFCLYFANSNFLTPYNQLQRRLGRARQNKHFSIKPAFDDPSNQELLAKLQQLGSANFTERYVKLYAKAARARLGWSGEEAQLFTKLTCGYSLNTDSPELQATHLDKAHVNDLMEEAAKQRRLLALEEGDSLQDTVPLPCRMRHAVHVCRCLEQWQQPPTTPEPGKPKRGWKPPAGQVEPRLVRPAWSQQRDQPVRGMMWCPVVAPRKPPQAPRSSQAATQPAAASEPGPSTPLPAKRSKRTKAEPAAEPTKGKGKAAKAKPAPQPGRWLDRDCNAALNMQRIGESRWRPLELCYWPDQGALPAKGKEYPGLGYKRLRDKPPKAQEQQQQQPAEAQGMDALACHIMPDLRCLRTMLIHKDLRFANGNPAFSCTLSLCKAKALNEHEAKGLSNDFLTIVSYWGNKPDLNVLFNLHVAHGDDGRLTPVFWGYMLAPGLIAKVTEMLDKSLLAVVFDLDETLLMANTASSAESRMKSLQNA